MTAPPCRCLHRAARPATSIITLLVLVTLLLSGCAKEKPPPPQRPPADVTAITLTPHDTPVAFDFVGQTQSSREVEIRARVDGFLEKRMYVEGDLVRTNQPMFQMDRKPFEASLQQARGELAQQQARLETARANLNRIKPLAAQNAVSKKDLDDATGSFQSAEAAVLSAQGNVRQAELNLGYTTIFSPLTGLSSFAKKQDGSYLSASDSLLTSVAQLDPIWVNYSISENELLRYRELGARGLLKIPASRELIVEVILADGSVYPNRGRVSFADPSFSKETGTFLVRAVLANPKGVLRPGQFVRVKVHGAERPDAILVPQRAVQQGSKSHFVWVVNKDGKAEQRIVEVGDWHGDNWFINDGLKPGEKVVVDGALKVAAGAPLKVTDVELKLPQADAATSVSTSGPIPAESKEFALTPKPQVHDAPPPSPPSGMPPKNQTRSGPAPAGPAEAAR